MQNPPFQIGVATPAEQRPAIELVLQGVAPSARSGLIDAVAAQPPERLGALDALIVARTSAGIVGATWAQPSPGQAAALWPPETTDDAPDGIVTSIVDGLLTEALHRAETARVVLVQALFEVDDDPRIRSLLKVGFQRMAELLYMGRGLKAEEALPSVPDAFQFEPYQESEFNRLKRALQATYVDSLDCPGMEGRRDQEDMLAGYRSTGQYKPSDWFFVRHAKAPHSAKGSQDDGVLLLTEHPASQQYELVYMGVAPHARGQRLGQAIVAEAIRVSACRGADQLVVAVDSTNGPARRLYEAAGFITWTRRFVYVR